MGVEDGGGTLPSLYRGQVSAMCADEGALEWISLGSTMVGHHNYWLVLLSVIVSITASYVALEAVFRVAEQRRRSAGWSWLALASAALGTGIWSMHFIGMFGFELPVRVSYDVPRTLLSLAIAVLSAALAFRWVSGRAVRLGGFLIGGVLVGCGIAGMHYVGMAALKMQPPIRYDRALVALSILIAISAAIAALWCTSCCAWRTSSLRSGRRRGVPSSWVRRSTACTTLFCLWCTMRPDETALPPNT